MKILWFLALMCLILPTVLGADEYKESTIIAEKDKPRLLHYQLYLQYEGGDISVKDILVDNYQPQAYDYPDGECRHLGVDRTVSEYSKNVNSLICRNPDESWLNEADSFVNCQQTRSSNRTKGFMLDIENSSGYILLSAAFEFAVETRCFDCLDDEEKKRSACLSADNFGFEMALPYHEDAQRLVIYRLDDEKEQVTSAGLSEFDNAPYDFSY